MKHHGAYAVHLVWIDGLTRDVLDIAPVSGSRKDGVRADLAGLLATAYVAAIECCIKEIFKTFGKSKSRILESVAEHNFEKINSAVHYDTIADRYAGQFGVVYREKFRKLLGEAEARFLVDYRTSLRSSYGNLIKWRHAFAHEGLKLCTLEEVTAVLPSVKEMVFITDTAMS